jgi:hypothetical protein
LHLALDVPKSQVEGAYGVGSLAAGWIEEGSVHVLPQPLDVLRVAADESSGGLGEGVLHAPFADAGDARIGFDGDHHVALV